MLSTNRTFPVRSVIITDEVRVPSPKKRTPLSKAPSVTPHSREDQLLAGSKVFGFVNSILILDSHPREAFFLIRFHYQPAQHYPFRQRIAAAVITPSGAPPDPMTTCTLVPITAAAIPAERSPSPISRIRAPAARMSAMSFS